MRVHCNAGTVELTQQGYFGDYPLPVWYNPKGIANILSLHNVSKLYQVQMDTSVKNSINVLHKGTPLACFQPTSKGLYRCELTDDRPLWCLVNTVAANVDRYTNRAYKNAVLARRMQNIIMRPGSRRLKDVAINHLKNCPVTRSDVDAADDIFGTNIGSLKGKTVHRPNPHVQAGVDPVPPEILQVHRSVILAIDIMFVNKIPFLVTTSRNLHFGTIEALQNRQVTSISKKIKSVVKLYTHRGFHVGQILADPEFEPIRPDFPMLNCCGADEHVPEIERYIRTVKDRTRSSPLIECSHSAVSHA
eukprot:scaffold3632_cov158-Cylindrotheca_fusiformis.AAC.1